MGVNGGVRVPLVVNRLVGRCDDIFSGELKVSLGVFWMRVNGEVMFWAGVNRDLWVGSGIKVVARF